MSHRYIPWLCDSVCYDGARRYDCTRGEEHKGPHMTVGLHFGPIAMWGFGK
jgi:hypothetical protein